MVDTEPDIGEHKYEQEAASELFIHSRQRYVWLGKKGATIPVEGKFPNTLCNREMIASKLTFLLKARFRWKILTEKSYWEIWIMDHPKDPER